MCGITGFLLNQKKNCLFDAKQIALSMSKMVERRGPDDFGYWSDNKKQIHLTHRRLSIIDLSKNGHQPMISANKRFSMTYNGEVYNYQDLAQELKSMGCRFRGTSDSEVILEAFCYWGIEKTLQKMIGMFAIALWDSETGKLYLIRDRLGIKPLYWGKTENAFLFSSTLHAFHKFPEFKAKINQDSLALYLYYGYIPRDYCIFQQAYKVAAGSYVVLKESESPKIVNYWNLADKVQQKNKFSNFLESKSYIKTLIKDSIEKRMITDVPFGAFLSGGIDSSLVTSIMQDISNKPIKTFSIGFDNHAFNEATDAKKIAQHLKTEHHELYIDSSHLLDIAPNIAQYYDEPFFDSSSIPTFILSQLTRQHVTVALSGDGGDELFAGYNRYLYCEKIKKYTHQLPFWIRKVLYSSIKFIPQRIYDFLSYPIQKKMGLQAFGQKAHKLADCIKAKNSDEIYKILIKQSQFLVDRKNSSNTIENLCNVYDIPQTLSNDVERMQYYDMLCYMNDDILTKVDRASMANALEVRVPLIDHRIVEASWKVPLSHKIHQGQSKYILRQILKDYVPENLFDRPKMGFGVPLNEWLRCQLHDWARTILYETDWCGVFNMDSKVIRTSWHRFLKYGSPSATQIWILISLVAWHNGIK